MSYVKLAQKALHKKQAVTEIKIADIMFAQDNHKLIHALKARGSSIVKQKWDKVK